MRGAESRRLPAQTVKRHARDAAPEEESLATPPVSPPQPPQPELGARRSRIWQIVAIVVVILVVIGGIVIYVQLTRPPSAVCTLGSKNPLIFDQPESPDNTDPATTFSTPGWGIVQQVYQGLVMYNQSSYTTFLPILAKNWTFSTDHFNITFHLRPGAHFSNGDPVNAYVMWFSLYRSHTRTSSPRSRRPSPPRWIPPPSRRTVASTPVPIRGWPATCSGAGRTRSSRTTRPPAKCSSQIPTIGGPPPRQRSRGTTSCSRRSPQSRLTSKARPRSRCKT